MSNRSTTQALMSDLAQAAAGLRSLRKSTPAINPPAILNSQASVANTNPVPDPESAATLAAGLRSLQTVESILKSHHDKLVPPHPFHLGGKITPEEERAWKRARSAVYTQRNRAKKSEQIELLERGIAFFKRQLGIQDHHPNTKEASVEKKPSTLMGVKRKEYLPPIEQLQHMSKKEVSEWKRKERLKRKRKANAETTKQQQKTMLNLAIEHEELHDRYREKCRLNGTVEEDWSRHSTAI